MVDSNFNTGKGTINVCHDPRISSDPAHKIETDNPALMAAEMQRDLYPQGIDWDKVKQLAEQCDELVPVIDHQLTDSQLAAGVEALRAIRKKFNGNETDGAIVYAVYFAVVEATRS